MAKFTYKPSKWVPFRDVKAIDRCRRIKRSQIEKHPNKDFRIRVVPDEDVAFLWFGDIVGRILRARQERRNQMFDVARGGNHVRVVKDQDVGVRMLGREVASLGRPQMILSQKNNIRV